MTTFPTQETTDNVITLADRRAAQSEHFKEWTNADIRRFSAPAFTALPFVTRKEVPGKLSQAVSFWNDIPSGDGMSDYKTRGHFCGNGCRCYRHGSMREPPA